MTGICCEIVSLEMFGPLSCVVYELYVQVEMCEMSHLYVLCLMHQLYIEVNSKGFCSDSFWWDGNRMVCAVHDFYNTIVCVDK